MTNKISFSPSTKAGLESFLADPINSVFLNDEAKDIIREKLKGQLEDW